ISPLKRRNRRILAHSSGLPASNASRAMVSMMRRSKAFARHAEYGILAESRSSHFWRNAKTRASRFAKKRFRTMRRNRMNVRSSPSATAATIMAFSTKGAGPSLQILSKMDAIAESQIGIGAVLRAALIGSAASDVVPLGEAETQSAAIGLRGEPANLIGAGKVFGARGEEDTPGELRNLSRE